MIRTETYKDLCHGTTADAAAKIKNNGFIPSAASNSWCGPGIYFYDIKAKAWWSANRTCEKIKAETGKKVAPDVVYADIIDIPRNDIFDLRAPTDVTCFQTDISAILEGKSKLLIKEISDEQERIIALRTMLIDFYAENNKKKLIIGIFQQREQLSHTESIKFAAELGIVLGVETIFCVRDASVITNIR